jgi:dTDP-4-dehydrorhamnose 3,5-epimerase
MNFIETSIFGVVICEPIIHSDNRGYFIETYRQDRLEEFIGYKVNFCQDNESKSSYGVLRGFHYQVPPYSQAKLVRVTKGKVLDVVVDIREGSPTFGEHVSVELSEDNHRQLFIPKGFAHAYVVLSDEAIFAYKVDDYYSKEFDKGIIFNDSDLNVDWKIDHSKLELAERDKFLPKLNETNDLFKYMDNLYD